MGVELLTERHASQIAGVLGCWDRMLVFGTLPKICFAAGMTSFLYERKIRIFDYPKFAEPFRNQIRENAEKMAAEAGIQIEFIRKRNFRKEDRAKEILASRGEQTGLVCIFSAMEPCSTYKPWHNKQSGKTFLISDDGKCLHYYFYFVDEDLGLCHVRVPTWLPCRLQICFNGHNWLAGQLRRLGIDYRMADNGFSHIADWQRAQRISNGWEAKRIHARLDEFARRCCPIYRDFATGYHWSVDQCEYATDIVFRKQADLQAIYENLARTAIHTLKPDNIATFLGRKLSPQFEGEMGNRCNIRIEGTRIKHTMGPVSIKLYDKFGLILRIETTVNDLTFFKHYREVEHRDGSRETKWASMQKTIYSPPCASCSKPPTGATWSSSRRLRIPAPEETNSTNSHSPWNRKADDTPGSIYSTRTMRTCCVPSFAASSTSADCRTKHFGSTCRNSAAVRYRACSNDSERTDSSKKSATRTSTTSLPLARKSLLRLSNFGNL